MKRFASLAVLLCVGLLLVGCSGVADTVEPDAIPVETSTTASTPELSIEEQARAVTDRDDVALDPMDDAQAWLGNEDLAAYSDPNTHDEFIADTSSGQLLSYTPGTAIYQDPITLPLYEGEPSREEVIDMADAWAREYAPQYDISTMRRTAWRRVAGIDNQGDLLEYVVEYHSYVDGVRVPEWVNVTVSLPTWVWVPSLSAFEDSDPYDEVGAPEVGMLEAIDTAADEAGMVDYTVKRSELVTQDGGLQWTIELEDNDVDTTQLGGGAAWMQVDALTGEVAATAH